ncbi:JmjC domain-containing protein [Caenorhabditis elegans]|nr:JmjC domain-containing protein [Caenorhabditis elegans]CZR14607.1 JmjC domain-containing protein [Caenorhabditis elegans]|eukprot:NP_001309681.1 JuMonJi (transcription factor) Domain protein [Caenorhabditis elegans]
MKYQLPLSPTAVNGELYDRTYPLTSFATNVDLKEEQKFQPLIQELDKLPNFLKTKGGLNEYIKESIGGVNEVQMYFKQPGSRTTCHIENQAIGSLNLNLGPGKCIWYAVASEHSAKFEQLLMKKNLWPYDSVLWPNEEELLNWGIPVMKFIQETDDTVYVGTGTYHWVQSIGFTGNVSWNIAESTFDQFAMAALVHDHNTEQSYDSVLPIIPMAWEMAKKRAFLGTEMYPLIKSILARSLAKSTFELDKAKSAGAKISNIEDASVELSHVERCQGKKCKRDVLFNTVVIKQNSRNKTEKLCVDCCHNMKGSTVIMRHTINELVTIYNEY